MNSPLGRVAWLLIPCSVAVAACGRLLDTRNPSRRSSGMVLFDGAQDVKYYRNHDRSGREELEGISYLVDAQFPAERMICQVTSELTRAGWRPLRRTHDDGATPSSFLQGWRVIINRRGFPDEHHVDLWDAEWVNGDGDLLSYSLTYRYPSRGTANRTQVRVGGISQPAGTVSPSDREATRRGGEIPSGQRPQLTPTETATCG